MRSLKNNIRFVILVLLFIFVILIGFNVFYINNLTKKLYVTHYLIGEIKDNYIELGIPLSGLYNYSSQNSETLNGNQLENLIEEHDQNIKSINELFSNNRIVVRKSKIMINDYKNSIVFKHFNLFEKNYESIILIEEDMNSLYLLVKSSLNNGTVIKNNFSAIKEKYDSMKPIIDETIYDFDQNIVRILDSYVLSNNILISLMGLIVLFLILFLSRINRIDLSYIIKAFSQMNQQDYQLEKLPKFEPKFIEEKNIQRIIHEVFQEQNFLQKIKNETSRDYVLTGVLENLFKMIEKKLTVDRVGVAFVNHKDRRIIAEYGIANYDKILLDADFNVSFDETSLYDIIKNPKPLITNDLEKLYKSKPKSRALKLIFKEGIKSNIIFPLIIDHSVFGFLFFSSVNKNQFDEKTKVSGENIAREIAAILDKTYLAKMIFSKITLAFADLVEKKDTETGEHLIRMVEYTRFIAQLLENHPSKEYSVTKKFISKIVENAPVHDIGKVAIPDRILKKPGKLDADEWEIMKTHASVGADIFSDLKESLSIFDRGFYSIAENITRFHHEKWNGEGYPEGLKGIEIPLEARIVAIADVFDALTSKRVYKDGFSFKKAWDILEESSGEHFDPELLRILKKNKKAFRKLYSKLHKMKEIS